MYSRNLISMAADAAKRHRPDRLGLCYYCHMFNNVAVRADECKTAAWAAGVLTYVREHQPQDLPQPTSSV
jgi:hypothetical protein